MQPQTPPTVSLHTLGCKLNQTETATIGRQFVRAGYRVVPFGEVADVVVVNTCSVTEKADKECRQLVRRIRRTAPDAFVAVVGCYAQLRPDEVASLRGVDLVAGTAEKFDIVGHALQGRRDGAARVLRSEPGELTKPVVSHSEGLDRTRGFLKIQDGCDYTCSFCTIPLARGRSRSVDADEVILEARHLARSGFRELVLTGVNTGDYGRQGNASLLSLLERLVAIDGLERIRISSVEPNLLSDDLLDFWIGHDKVCKHWHVPLQSGSAEVLRAMRRRYTPEWYRGRLEKIQSAHPRAGIGADVIVGFPGETDAAFEETLSFVKELPFSYLHVFSYSSRPWTDAAGMSVQVDPRVRAARSGSLRQLADRKKRMFNESFIGSDVRVLVEGPDETGLMTGLSEEYVRVRLAPEMVRENDLVIARIGSAEDWGCTGTPIDILRRSHEVHHAVA